MIPATMNAIRLHVPGGPEGLIYEQIETPQPKAGEVLVRVHAAAITRDELDWPVNCHPSGYSDSVGLGQVLRPPSTN